MHKRSQSLNLANFIGKPYKALEETLLIYLEYQNIYFQQRLYVHVYIPMSMFPILQNIVELMYLTTQPAG